jgi:hypothetical protein
LRTTSSSLTSSKRVLLCVFSPRSGGEEIPPSLLVQEQSNTLIFLRFTPRRVHGF